jgi:hypothetical protein
LKKENKWMNNRKCLNKNERKKQSFKSKIIQRFIFVLFTTHFRIHQSLFTAFFIHERRSFSMNFRKNLIKNSISILNEFEWSIARLIMRKQAYLAWKTQDFSHEERHSQSWMTIVIFTMSFRLECDHAKIASSQMCYVIVCKKRLLSTKKTHLVFCRSRASWRQVRHAFNVCYSHRMIHKTRW